MFRPWSKLRRLQPILKPLNRKVYEIQMQIRKARHDLLQAQDNLQHNLFDTQAIKHVKYCTNRVVYLNQLEETILMPKAIVTWLKLGDNNNSYFHAFVKEKNKQKGMYTMTSLNGELLTNHESIEK